MNEVIASFRLGWNGRPVAVCRTQLRVKFKTDGQFYRVFPNGEVWALGRAAYCCSLICLRCGMVPPALAEQGGFIKYILSRLVSS